MELSKLIIPSKPMEFEYPGVEGLTFTISHLSRKKITDMRKAHTKLVKSKVTTSFIDELDEDAFMKEYTSAVLSGWKGLDTDNVQNFIVIEPCETADIEYTVDNAYQLMINSQELEQWVADKLVDIENFRNKESSNKEE